MDSTVVVFRYAAFTKAPLPGFSSIKPNACNILYASRIVERPTPSNLHNSFSGGSFWPTEYSPDFIEVSNCLIT